MLAALLPGAVAAQSEPALVIQQGSVARYEVVTVGRDLEVAGEALSDVAVVAGSALISGHVDGDVIVLGGSARLAATARVAGDVFVLGGTLEAAGGAQIEGRTVSYPTVNAAWLTLMEGPSLGLPPFAPVVVGAKLALVAAWLALCLVFFAIAGREVISTSEAVQQEPFRCFFVGLTAVLAMVMTCLFFSAFAAALVGIPLLVLVVLAALVLKLWGMVAVFHALGHWLSTRLLRRRIRTVNAAVLGLMVLGLLKLLPWTGVWVWTTASLIGVGASLATKLGRRQPWFQGDAAAALAPLP